MGFIKKIWKDRISEFPTRRSLTKTDGTSELVTVARSEGMISEEGDAFSAENMNDFENRVANGFNELNEKIIGISGEVKYGYISIPTISYTAYGLKDITASFDVEFEKAPSMVFLFTNSKTSVMPVCCFDITASTLGVRLFQTRAESTTASANTYIRYIAIFN